MPHVEQKTFDIRLELRCEFPDDYQGEADGYAWVEGFRPLAADVLRAVVQAVGRHPGWSVRPANRGRSSDDEVLLVVERKVE